MKKLKKILNFKSLKAEEKFWATHDSTAASASFLSSVTISAPNLCDNHR